MALSKEQIEDLKKDFEAEEIPVTEIARKYGVGRTTVIRLAKNLKWKVRKKINLPQKKKKAQIGRPEKYKPEYAKQATALCLLGYTNEKLANFFNVMEETVTNWKKAHPEFLGALLEGREKAGTQVAVSLFQRAVGYSHPEEKIFCYEGEIITHKTTKHYPPEVKAMTLWLKNKFPELWRDKQEIDFDGTLRVGEITKEDAKAVDALFKEITEE